MKENTCSSVENMILKEFITKKQRHSFDLGVYILLWNQDKLAKRSSQVPAGRSQSEVQKKAQERLSTFVLLVIGLHDRQEYCIKSP